MTTALATRELALKLAAAGRRVFPVHWIGEGGFCSCSPGRDCRKGSPGKHPLTGSGLHDASADLDQVNQWWREWPDANLAVATGEASRLLVLDVDPAHGGEESLARMLEEHGELPETVRIRTGGGGLHFYFAWPAGDEASEAEREQARRDFRNRANLAGYHGLDIRGEGGYVVGPGSNHASGGVYSIEHRADIAQAPGWLLDLIRKPAARKPTGTPAPRPATTGGTPYGRKGLEGELAELHGAQEGERNHALNRAAFSLGQLVAGGQLDEGEVRAELHAAAVRLGLEPGEIGATIESGLRSGMEQPRTPPERGRNGPARPAAPAPDGAPLEDPGPAVGAPDDERPPDRDPAEEEVIEDGDFEDEGGLDWSEDSLALDLTKRWGLARYVDPWGRWFFFDGIRWEPDEKLEHLTRTRRYLRGRADDFLASPPVHLAPGKVAKAAKDLKSSGTVAAVAKLARSNPECAARVEEWDRDPYLLGTPAGTVDLRTGELRQADPEDRITKVTAVAPAPSGARAPLWEKFLRRITAEDDELVRYLQRYAGYSLTGSVQEHAFAFGYGTGQNGKSVFLEALGGLLGDYALTFPTEMLMQSPTDRHPTELARLRGVRLAIGSETEDGRRWAESKIKALTGGDRIAARYMRQDFFEFSPSFKLFVVGNHMPSLRGVDKAIRRRLHLVPFTVTIPEKEVDRSLGKKLEGEWPQVLRWAIEGALAWQREGLNPPAIIREATEKYLTDEDAIVQWMREKGQEDDRAFQSTVELWESWSAWAREAGEDPETKRRLTKKLREHGLIDHSVGSARGFRGFRLHYVDTGEGARRDLD